MKNILLVLGLLVSFLNFSQTTLLSPTGAGGFELGTTLASNGWTAVQSTLTTRIWQCGTGQAGYTGSRSAFIGNSTTTVGTTTAARTVHIYRSISIPLGATNISLTFKYKQAVVDNTFDYLRVTLLSTIPVNGTLPSTDIITTIDPTVAITTYASQTVTIPNSYAGTTRNLVFTFRCDGVTPHAYGAVDDIGITYTPPSNCTGTPNAGTVTSSVNNQCSGTSTTLTANGLSSGLGITYQWESSPNNSTWSNVVGATSTTYNTTLPNGTMYYRVVTTCSFSSTSNNTTSVTVTGLNCVLVPSTGTNTTSTCSGTLYDPAGTGSYTNNNNGILTINPSTPGSKIQLVFSTFTLETCCDNLKIYNGNSVASPLMGTYTTSPGTIVSSAADGSLTLNFSSDGSVTDVGFVAAISCIVPPAPSCIASPTTPTNGAINQSLTTTLTWPIALYAESYDVYFGTTLPGTPTTNTTSTTYNPGTLLAGTTYYWKIVPKNSVGEPTGCSTWSFTTLTPPVNDNPSGAITLTIGNTTTYSTYTNLYSTNTTTETTPSCAAYTGEDVWFKVTLPQYVTSLDFDTQTGVITDGGMAIYRGVPGSLVEIQCDDDSSPNGAMSFISRTDFFQYETIYIRIWEYNGGTTGTFGISVTTPQPLPVELGKFEGILYPMFNLINWTTESENNSSYFDLESSIDGENWKVITTSPAAGNSNEKINYSYIDNNLSEIVYYRLQQFDIDGKYETFGPIVITRDVKNKQIIGYINLLGQKVDPKYTTGVIIEVYEDGTMIKKIR
jgi:hypothetical protein